MHEAESPRGLLYRMVIAYTCLSTTLVFATAIVDNHYSQINFYFTVNFCTVTVLTWLIRKSFNIISRATYIAVFRIGLFLLLNSTLISMAGGLSVLNRDAASVTAALLYAPALMLIIYSFNRFVSYADSSYQSAVALSLTDELTGLPNRRHLNLRLMEVEKKKADICILDIDHFKRLNDTYGHDTGDKVLRNFGFILSRFSSENVFLARSGGEEFCIIITGDTAVTDILSKIKASSTGGCNGGISLTFSAGVASKKAQERSSGAVIKADEALYRAKKAGRDRIVLSS
ncbi:GGDEF domain-containing protein [Pantoea stewartii]|uniref:GGDEF domain-containing protein n=1 Tax=Pantoea stewartii TaxID=66269 RepID=UPI002DBB4BAC|nr:GGDEF domain-containing protein [Pantoea stewartii]MEB6537109.1 GGDEF domain-containing protein [Pantoea stewartii]